MSGGYRSFDGDSGPAAVAAASTTGGKTIGARLSVAFIVNQIFGPGVLAIPIVFQQSGWLFATLALLFFAAVSCFSSTLLCGAIARIPGNHNFERRVEFAGVVEYYFGKRAVKVFHLFYNVTIQSYNVASIVIVANSIDQFLISFAGKTFALELSPDFGFHAFRDIEVLYNAPYVVIPLGYVLLGIVCIPLGMKNLNENARTVQTASFVMTILLLLLFLGYFAAQGAGNAGPPTALPPPPPLDGSVGGSAASASHTADAAAIAAHSALHLGRVSGLHSGSSSGSGSLRANHSGQASGFHPLPAVGDTFSQLASVFIFTWAYVIFVPSWLNEKQAGVRVNATIWTAGAISATGYLALGLLCALATPDQDADNMLVHLSQPPTPLYARLAAHLYALFAILPGVNVCSITTRYNLSVAGICSPRWAVFWGVFSPWLVGFVFLQGKTFAMLLNWSSLLFNGCVNYLVPMALFYKACFAHPNAPFVGASAAAAAADGAAAAADVVVLTTDSQAGPLYPTLSPRAADDAADTADDAADNSHEGKAAADSSSVRVRLLLHSAAASEDEEDGTLHPPSSSQQHLQSSSAARSRESDALRPASAAAAIELVDSVNALPACARSSVPRAKCAVAALFACTAGAALAQVLYDLYYLLVLGQNLLD